MIEFNELLLKAALDPAKVMVMRHRPTEEALRRALPKLAAERPELYNAYQSNHGERVEAALGNASYLASFIGHEPGKALFVGIYKVVGWKEISSQEFWRMECNRDLRNLGTRGVEDGRRSRWFDLVCTEHMAKWKGKLVVAWPGIERSWWRWAARNVMTVDAVHDESRLVSAMPAPQDLVLNWAELQTLPVWWQAAISQWRGVYLILDKASGKGYVGSAYGDDNILGRWRGYAATGDGGNVGLKKLDPAHFQFSVLQLVSPEASAVEVTRLEETWKKRLGTRDFGLNKN